MTTTIGSVTLSNDMIFQDRENHGQVDASVEKTLGGGIIVQEFERTEKGRPVTLRAANGHGYQEKSVVDDLEALAAVAGATYTLTIISNSITFSKTVRFRNEEDGGPVQFRQAGIEMDGNRTDGAWMEGTIFLMVA
jgi:hypothetical protein